MWSINEENLTEFKVISRNRLDPLSMAAFMFGTMFWSCIIMFFIIVGLIKFGWSAFPTPFEKMVVTVELVFFVLQIFIIVFYSKPRRQIKYQKFLSILILFYAFQLATIGFMGVVIKGVFNFPNDVLTLTYIGLIIIGGIVTHIVCTFTTFKQAEKGAFDSGESSSGFFNKTIITTAILALVYTFIILVLIYIHNISEVSLGDMGFYFVLSVILYAVAIGAAEFQLMAYCKWRFPSFNITCEEFQRVNREMNRIASKRKRS